MAGLNHELFLLLNAGAAPPAPVVLFAMLAAKVLIALVPLHIALVWCCGTRPMRFVALTGVLALPAALSVNAMLGLIAYTPRPFLLGLGHTLIDHRPSASFPSNHATVFFIWAATLALCGLGRLALRFGGLGLLVAWSRVYLGVHFPADMAGAAVVAALSAALSLQVMLRWGSFLLGSLERVTGRFTRLSQA
jgi:undecaprenyl-diphosphatase